MSVDRGAVRRAAFLDRDGVINIDHGYVWRRQDFDFVPGVRQGARRLHELGFALIVVTNQSGIGRGLYSVEAFESLTAWMNDQFAAADAPIAGVYYCPHHPTEAVGEYRRDCPCRKPAPGMLLDAARDLDIDLSASVMFGDRESDLMAALAAGIPRRVLLGMDGRQIPVASTPSLAIAAYRRLDEAMDDKSFLMLLDGHSAAAE